jgi:exopolysaccharide production protein ExoQ
VFISTFTESFAWATFNTPLNLLYLGALATLSPGRRKLVGQAPVYVNSGMGYVKA